MTVESSEWYVNFTGINMDMAKRSRFLLSAGTNNELVIWDLATQNIHTVQNIPFSPINKIINTENLEEIILIGSKKIITYNSLTHKITSPIKLTNHLILDVGFLKSDKKILYFITETGYVGLFDRELNKILLNERVSTIIYDYQFINDTVYVLNEKSEILQVKLDKAQSNDSNPTDSNDWKNKNVKISFSFNKEPDTKDPTYMLLFRFSPLTIESKAKIMYCATFYGKMYKYVYEIDEKENFIILKKDLIFSVDWNNNFTFMKLLLYEDNVIVVYLGTNSGIMFRMQDNGEEIIFSKLAGHTDMVKTLLIKEDMGVSCGLDGFIRIWDLGRELNIGYFDVPDKPVLSIGLIDDHL